jgi:hypothetical protein
LKDGVARKYGNPLGNSGGTTHSITGKAFEENIGMIYVTLAPFFFTGVGNRVPAIVCTSALLGSCTKNSGSASLQI